MHGFSPYLQYSLALTGSSVSQLSVTICQQLLSYQHFKGFGVLTILTSQLLKPINACSTKSCFLILLIDWAGVPA